MPYDNIKVDYEVHSKQCCTNCNHIDIHVRIEKVRFYENHRRELTSSPFLEFTMSGVLPAETKKKTMAKSRQSKREQKKKTRRATLPYPQVYSGDERITPEAFDLVEEQGEEKQVEKDAVDVFELFEKMQRQREQHIAHCARMEVVDELLKEFKENPEMEKCKIEKLINLL